MVEQNLYIAFCLMVVTNESLMLGVGNFVWRWTDNVYSSTQELKTYLPLPSFCKTFYLINSPVQMDVSEICYY